MSQIVIYKGVMVEPLERSAGKILVRTSNPADAAKAGIPFKALDAGKAFFETWVSESELVPVNS